jgi:hypothetical protein
MKLQAVAPPEGGSLSIVYSCPECGYEMAMLTNPYETQVVQSLGVRIGPDTGGASTATSAPAASKCPFTAMIPEAERATNSGGARSAPAGAERGEGVPASDGVGGPGGAKPPGLDWTAAAEARLAKVPDFVRPMARVGIEKFARDNGSALIDDKVLDAARDFFGM